MPRISGIPIHAVMRQFTGSEREHHGSFPLLAKYFSHVLFPTQIVGVLPGVVFVGGTTLQYQIGMVQQQNGAQKHGSKVSTPEKNVDLEPGHVEGDQTDEWENELGQDIPRERHLSLQELGIEKCAIANSQPHVEKEHTKVAMISVSNAISHEHAMMLALQDTHPTNGAMPRPRRLDRLTRCTKVPLLLDDRRKDHVPGACIGQP